MTTALRYVSRKAYRRILAGAPPLPDDGRRVGWTPYFDRFDDVDRQEMIRLACREVWQLGALTKDLPFVDAVDMWLGEGDAGTRHGARTCLKPS